MCVLERGPRNWYSDITSKQVAPLFHQYLMEKEYRKRIDFSDKGARGLWEFNQSGVSRLISTMPMKKWSGSSKGLITFTNDTFHINLNVNPKDEKLLFNWTKEICEYRLHYHFERKG